jgi:anaerobic magnesium-protoporphyrin IX monomethyl ester cyclase
MKKVLLINPPQTYYGQSQGFSVYYPLGLLNIAAMVRDICKVEIFDCLIEDFEISKSEGMVRYGANCEKIKKKIQDYCPDIVGITIPFTAQAENALHISALCREINPDITVVFGGPDSSVRYSWLLENKFCDYCVIGEGEETFKEFIGKYPEKKELQKIEGLAFNGDNGRVVFRPREFIDDLDCLSLPAYDLVAMEKYEKSQYLYRNRSLMHGNSISMITSRGCPYHCVFCSVWLHMGRKYRYYSANYVLDHLALCVKKYHIRNFHFEDDNISLNRKRFEEILDGIIERKLSIRWDTPNGVRADSLDKPLLLKMKESGCKQLTLAIESGNQNILSNVIKKNTSLDYMLEIAKYCYQLNIRTNAFYVIGFPGETLEDMRDTINLALRLLHEYDILPNLYVATPLYGTELYTICVEKGFIDHSLSSQELATATQIFGNPLIETDTFTRKDVRKLIDDYLGRLKVELVRFSIKHPLFALKKAKDKVSVIKKIFLGSKE